MPLTPSETVLLFLEAITSHDPDKLAQRMTENHTFIDSLGHKVHGRANMLAGWRAYFALCPDYWLTYEQLFASGNFIAIFGAAGGTIHGETWQTPAAWLVIVKGELVQEWRVYADSKPVYDILASHRAPGPT